MLIGHRVEFVRSLQRCLYEEQRIAPRKVTATFQLRAICSNQRLNIVSSVELIKSICILVNSFN